MLKGVLVATPPIKPQEFDIDRARARLVRILGDERPHPVDSDASDAVRDRLLTEIRAIGYEPDLRDDFACRQSKRWSALACARVRNVVFRAGPTGGGAVLLASHYDSVAAGPGAADDGAGVAATLEIAAILKKRRPAKPVIFLITEGEEDGLIGAASFVREDPLAGAVEAVINMEARGVTGPALLFQTSDPNGRDIAAYAQRARDPFGNSLAANIYKMMPNDTDLSEFLALGPDAVNLAFSGRVAYYHTPHDNLRNLDRRSLAHLGASALAALDGFLAAAPDSRNRAESVEVYADVGGRFIIVVPRIAALASLLFGLIVSAIAFARIGGAAPFIAAAAPLIAVIAAGAASFGAVSLIAAARAEETFWYASPHWTRAVIYLSAIGGGAAALSIAAGAGRNRLLCAGWFWFSALGLAAYAVAPGSALVTGAPAALFACAAISSLGAPRLLAPISLIALVAALIFWLPMMHLAEEALGVAGAWPIAGVAALLFMLAAPIVVPEGRIGWPAQAMLASSLVVAVILALTARAYSPAAPRGLNIAHIVTAAPAEAYWSLGASPERPPREMAGLAEFSRIRIKGLTGERTAAAAPPHDGAPIAVEILSSTPHEQGRALHLRIASNGADQVVFDIPDEAGLSEASIAGTASQFDQPGARSIVCSGRSCATFDLSVVVAAESAEWTVYGIRHGLGPESEALRAARPDWATPVHGGDARIVLSKATI